MVRPAILSTYRRVVVGVVLVFGTGLAVFTGHIAGRQEAERMNAGFLSRARTQATVATQRLLGYQEMVYSMRDAFLGQNTVTRQEFAAVARSLLERHAGVQALEWVEIVPRASRPALEQLAAAELGRPYVIRRRAADGSLQPAPADDEYWVVNYVEPLAGNEPALGYDVRTAPTAPILAAARASGRFKISQPFHLTQSSSADDEPGIIFILPFTRPHPDQPASEGFVQGVFRVETMLGQSHQLTTNEALDSYYLDLDDGRSRPTLLYANLGGAEPLRAPGATVALPPLDDPADFHSTIEIGDRQWSLVIRKNAAWANRWSSPQPMLMLGAGLIITILLAGFINSLLQRTSRIEREVQERTRELRNSERRLQDILDHSPAFINLKDPAGRYLLCNRLVAEFCRRPLHEIIGRRDDELFPAELAALYRQNDAQVLAAGRPMEFEETLPTPTGLRTTMAQKFPLRDEQGRIYAICAISTDITDRKEAEAEKLTFERNLRETQKLESLGVMAGGIAHDFNNILTSVLVNASLARELGVGGPEAGDHLRQIEQAARRAADLCQQLLAYAGKGKFVTGRVDLSELVRGTTSLLEVSLSKNTRLDLQLAAGLPAVMADPTQLRQIVMNLVINAADAIGGTPGRIAVRTFAQAATAAQLRQALGHPELPGGTYVGLEVRDDGCGMSPETIARIFEPFFTTKFSGRGLGLAAVQGIVQGHEGVLFVESKVGAGATFRLLLPATPGPAAHSTVPFPPSATAAVRLQGLVLVVDDEPGVRGIVATVLERHGATVLPAAGGEEALALLQASVDQVALVLLDLTMPGLTGEETLRRIRTIKAQQPVIIMSGYSESETIRRTAALGMAGFVHKPFEIETLLTKVQPFLT